MATSRADVLAAVGNAQEPSEPAPRWSAGAIRFADPVAAFRDALEAAGGELVVLASAEALATALGEAAQRAERVFSDRSSIPDRPAELDPARTAPDLALLTGGPAVAESGAVWWSPADERARRAGFLAERVILVVERGALVHDLHEAYRRIDPARAHFGCFVAGPSKTADIEQALVIGAHGPRALAVYLWDEATPPRA